ncbi:MAG: glycoside hydrolase family 125 protein [Eubacteriales bacterium]|nr:glycoside hydrolase family 125 protein [Eubacteriales bacterium]
MENPISVQELIIKAREVFKDEPRLADIFENCYSNTLNTTVKILEDETTYVITGDIPAMWLRDSTAQLRPYLVPARGDDELAQVIAGLVRRQFYYICREPYANAFNETASGACWEKDYPDQDPMVWEKKFEVDSLCYPIQLAYLLWKNTGLTSQFDENFRIGAEKILQVFRTEQRHEECSSYRFQRKGSFFTDTLSREGKGALTKPGIGLIWSGFRPSDDACTYGYLIPSNMFAVTVLHYLAEIAQEIYHESDFSQQAGQLAEDVDTAIEKYGITATEEFGEIYAYEVDGYGQFNLMDDANVPSLLSMKYLGYEGKRKDVAENTRRFLLSDANPFYYKGKAAAGIGSPHTPSGYIWHIAMAMEGLTAETKEEKLKILRKMADTDGGKNMMHEGFDCDDPAHYTREWFSWANAMYAELLLSCMGYEI